MRLQEDALRWAVILAQNSTLVVGPGWLPSGAGAGLMMQGAADFAAETAATCFPRTTCAFSCVWCCRRVRSAFSMLAVSLVQRPSAALVQFTCAASSGQYNSRTGVVKIHSV